MTESVTVTSGYLAYHAAMRPHALALIDKGGQTVTFRRFYDDFCRMRTALDKLALNPDKAVAVESSQFYVHWLVVLVLEARGIASLSFAKGETSAVNDLVDHIDHVVYFTEGLVFEGAKRTLIDQAWFDAFRDISPVADVSAIRIDGSRAYRIIKGSGTTGTQKYMIRTFAGYAMGLHYCQFRNQFLSESRCFAAMEATVQFVHLATNACLRAGGTVVRDLADDPALALSQYNITHATFLPVYLDNIFDDIEKRKIALKGLKLTCVGVKAPAYLRKRFHSLIEGEFLDAYATNEIGFVSTSREGGASVILPGVNVEVLDENGVPVLGKEGRLRIKSKACVNGYLNDEEASRRMFVDGWFYPGDIAIKYSHNEVELLGREDDLINVGGLKYLPQPFEESLVSGLAVTEAYLTNYCDEKGKSRVRVTLVPEDWDAIAELEAGVATLLPHTFGQMQVVYKQDLPRTPTGKVQRRKL